MYLHHDDAWEHYSQYNIPSHPIVVVYHPYAWEHYSQYNKKYTSNNINKGIVPRNVLNLKFGEQDDKNYIHKANLKKFVLFSTFEN